MKAEEKHQSITAFVLECVLKEEGKDGRILRQNMGLLTKCLFIYFERKFTFGVPRDPKYIPESSGRHRPGLPARHSRRF